MVILIHISVMFVTQKQVNLESLLVGLREGRGECVACSSYYLPGYWHSSDLFEFEKVVTEESWRRGSSLEEDGKEAQRIPRRRWGSGRRSRPRPLSDYGQFACRSLSIPEDSIAVDPQKEDIVDSDHQLNMASTVPADQNAAMGCPKGCQRRRPISVIGGVSFYGNRQTEAIETLLTQVRPGVLLPKPAEPSASWPLSPLQANRTLLSFLS